MKITNTLITTGSNNSSKTYISQKIIDLKKNERITIFEFSNRYSNLYYINQ